MVVERKIASVGDAQLAHKELVDYLRRRDDTFPPFGIVLKKKEIQSASSTNLAHGMGRPYNGYLIIKCDTQCTFVEVANKNKRETLTLQASSGTPIVDIWVF